MPRRELPVPRPRGCFDPLATRPARLYNPGNRDGRRRCNAPVKRTRQAARLLPAFRWPLPGSARLSKGRIVAVSISGVPDQLRQIAAKISEGDFAQIDAADALLWQAHCRGGLRQEPVLQWAADQNRKLNLDQAPYENPPRPEWSGLTYELLFRLGSTALPGFPSELSPRATSQEEGFWYARGLHALADCLAAAGGPDPGAATVGDPKAPAKRGGGRKKDPNVQVRNSKIAADFRKGLNVDAVADKYGISADLARHLKSESGKGDNTAENRQL